MIIKPALRTEALAPLSNIYNGTIIKIIFSIYSTLTLNFNKLKYIREISTPMCNPEIANKWLVPKFLKEFMSSFNKYPLSPKIKAWK